MLHNKYNTTLIIPDSLFPAKFLLIKRDRKIILIDHLLWTIIYDLNWPVNLDGTLLYELDNLFVLMLPIELPV